MKQYFKVLALLLVMSAFLSAPFAEAAYYDEGHSGNSWDDAYIIDSVEDLKEMRDKVNADRRPARYAYNEYYKLGADIDLTAETEWKGIGLPFRSHFDGQGHTIKINSNTSHGSLFRTIETSGTEAAIRNLNVEGTLSASSPLGGIVVSLESGIIENCSFSGSIEASDAAGGIAGLCSGTIKNCTFSGTVKCSSFVGGITGTLGGGTVDLCKTLSGSTVSGTSAAGGIVGSITSGNVTNCTSEATVSGSGTGYNGGIVGFSAGEAPGMGSWVKISNNTWPSAYPEVGNTSGTIPDAQYLPPSSSLLDIWSRSGRSVPNTLQKSNSNVGAERNASSLLDEERKVVSDDNAVIAAVLPVMSVNTSGTYLLGVDIDANVPTDAVLSLYLFPRTTSGKTEVSLSGEKDNATFFNDEGTEITMVPSNYHVNVSVDLTVGMTYAPVITAATSSNTPENGNGNQNEDVTPDSGNGNKDANNTSGSGGGGGCSAGFGMLGLLAAAVFFKKLTCHA